MRQCFKKPLYARALLNEGVRYIAIRSMKKPRCYRARPLASRFAPTGRGLLQVLSRLRCSCQGHETVTQINRCSAIPVQEYFLYRRAAVLVLEKNQLLAALRLSHGVIRPCVSATAIDFSGTNRANVGYC